MLFGPSSTIRSYSGFNLLCRAKVELGNRSHGFGTHIHFNITQEE